MLTYNLYEFDGYQLIENIWRNPDEPIDFRSRARRSYTNVIIKAENHNENAMFYQIRRCMKELSEMETCEDFREIPDNWGEYSLGRILIYISFSEVFPLSAYARRRFKWKKNTPQQQKDLQTEECRQFLQHFFEKGFSIKWEDEKEPIHYVPFEKSGSMSRVSKMLFIDSRLLDRMEERLKLGFDFCQGNVEISASKLYTYTGLYLSDVKRVNESGGLILNEKTVIVLPDNINHNKMIKSGMITGVLPEEGEISQKWSIRKIEDPEEARAEVNYFDGEGLISPAYCEEINRILHQDYGMKGTAASLQIRMPFTKGMLHSVDFHKFIVTSLGTEHCKDSCNGLWIKDAFGRKRNLGQAHIILTQSMFKMFHWLKESKITGLAAGGDPMKLYFDRFHAFDHALHIGNTDMNMTHAGKTPLNYQFLNTLDLRDDEFEALVKEQAELAASNQKKILRVLKTAHNDMSEAGDERGFDDTTDASGTWFYVVSRNPAFLSDNKTEGMMKEIRHSLLKDLGRGRLLVNGSVKFLSRDLLAFLSFMISRIKTDSLLTKGYIKSVRDEIEKNKLRNTKFFIADCIPDNPVFSGGGRLRLTSKEYCGLLRSPHLSRNEQCSLRPFIPKKDGLYAEYFGHLKGILMVPMGSFAPQALGGADFDGDLVKVIKDSRVNRAINDACYKKDNDRPAAGHVRRLPIIMIPDVNPRKIILKKGTIDFQTLMDTFSSKVGEISNSAFSYGKEQYGGHEQKESLLCESCTILTGLEIDAAKTGMHPDLSGILRLGTDYFIERKKKIDVLPARYKYDIELYPDQAGGEERKEPVYAKALLRNGFGGRRELLVAEAEPEFRIDTLPYRFLCEAANENIVTKQKEKPGVRFPFETDTGWKKKITQSKDPLIMKKADTVKNIVLAYRFIIQISREVYKQKASLKQSNYANCIYTILRMQYAGLLDDSQLLDLQDEIYEQLLDRICSHERARQAIHKLCEDQKTYQGWQFLNTNQEKEDYINALLPTDGSVPISQPVLNALCNFRWNGYYLLYYFIKDILVYFYENQNRQQIAEMEESSKGTVPDSEYYRQFRELYIRGLADREPAGIWKKRIVTECRRILREEFDNNVSEALKFTYALRKYDPSGVFFWDIFSADEILRCAEGRTYAE